MADTLQTSSLRKDRAPRDVWARQAEFLLSCIGYSVGLGNIWRFPYICMRNGGGAFLIPYFLFLLLCGLPLFFLELCLGQFSSLSTLCVWKICPLFGGLGWAMLIATSIVVLYYNLILTWVLYYLGMSLQRELPWAHCANPWNTPNCTYLANITSDHSSISDYGTNGTVTAAEEFWQYKVLNISSGIDKLGSIQWQLLLCLLVAWLIIYLCLFKGIKSSGKVVYVTATLPYLLLTVLMVRGVTLPGSLKGIKFYLLPDWKRLLEFQVWTDACLQIFYNLGPAWGSVITFASYNRFNTNCLRDATIICFTCCGTSLYGGFAVFSIIGYMAHQTGQTVENVISQGPGLAFVVYPEVLTSLPVSPVWAVCFFLMLFTLGLDSQFAFLETVIGSVADLCPHALRGKRRVLLTSAVCLAICLLDILLVTQAGIYIFQLVDWYIGFITPMVIALAECLIVSYIYGIKRFYGDITLMLKKKPGYVWKFIWCGITPFIIMVMIVISCVKTTVPSYGSYNYPDWAVVVGWMVAIVPLLPIPAVALYKLVQVDGTLYQRLAFLLKPESDWGPHLVTSNETMSLQCSDTEPLQQQPTLNGKIHDKLLHTAA